MKATPEVVFPQTCAVPHFHFAIMKVAGGRVVPLLFVVLLQSLINLGNQAVVQLVGIIFSNPQATSVSLQVNDLVEDHPLPTEIPEDFCLPATFPHTPPPFHRRKRELGNIAIVEESLTQIGLVELNRLWMRKLCPSKNWARQHFTVLSELRLPKPHGFKKRCPHELRNLSKCSPPKPRFLFKRRKREYGILCKFGTREIRIVRERCPNEVAPDRELRLAEICILLEPYVGEVRRCELRIAKIGFLSEPRALEVRILNEPRLLELGLALEPCAVEVRISRELGIVAEVRYPGEPRVAKVGFSSKPCALEVRIVGELGPEEIGALHEGRLAEIGRLLKLHTLEARLLREPGFSEVGIAREPRPVEGFLLATEGGLANEDRS